MVNEGPRGHQVSWPWIAGFDSPITRLTQISTTTSMTQIHQIHHFWGKNESVYLEI